MSGTITIQVRGVEQVQRRLSGAPERVAVRLRNVTMRLAIEAQRKVKQEQLSGQMLGVVTGRLRRSINAAALNEPNVIGASTGTNLVYGRAWQMGTATVFAPGSIGGRTKGRTRSEAAKLRSRRSAGARPFLSIVLEQMRADARQRIASAATGAV